MNIADIQSLVREFARGRGWEDYPNIDKFDHIHEELIEVSQYLRYKSRHEMEEFLTKPENMALIEEEMGDVLFGIVRLANQLGVDLEQGLQKTIEKVQKKYPSKIGKEHNSTWEGQKPGSQE